MLKKSTDKIYYKSDGPGNDYAQNTLQAFAEQVKRGCENWKDRLTVEVVSQDEKLF